MIYHVTNHTVSFLADKKELLFVKAGKFLSQMRHATRAITSDRIVMAAAAAAAAQVREIRDVCCLLFAELAPAV